MSELQKLFKKLSDDILKSENESKLDELNRGHYINTNFQNDLFGNIAKIECSNQDPNLLTRINQQLLRLHEAGIIDQEFMQKFMQILSAEPKNKLGQEAKFILKK